MYGKDVIRIVRYVLLKISKLVNIIFHPDNSTILTISGKNGDFQLFHSIKRITLGQILKIFSIELISIKLLYLICLSSNQQTINYEDEKSLTASRANIDLLAVGNNIYLY